MSTPPPSLVSVTSDASGRAAAPPRPERRRRGRGLVAKHVAAFAVAVVAVFPILYIFSASLNPNGTLVGSNSLFARVDLGNYIDLFNRPAQPYGAWFVNTLYIGVVASAGTVLLAALAAYAFSRMRFTGRRVGLVSILLVQMFPQLLGVVAIFLMLMTLGDVFPAIGLDTHAGLILIYLGGAMGVNTYLIYGFFNTVPSSIDEAAKLDGAGHARIFFTIILRLSAPILAVVALLSFIGTSSEFVVASVVLTDPPKQTLAVGLFQFISQETSANWSIFAAGAVLAAVPVVALFFALQKYIVGGLTAGAVK
ncbi:ABC transporter permease subunit [Sanguibacter hominis ATCC BAA-789]|uniref:ABC transporter permease subunit n=1 Tax=Sanguibacter hominis ATCC BAA-789 TaxID=1312740 RepID=A0A9X5IQ74_9MICO|nr:ABC transporter permease subunit [Sanguibacter hominis]NKX93887.1 ABC transporter permease subunit [Sanguibacter hominis ATCC BAA-789]